MQTRRQLLPQWRISVTGNSSKAFRNLAYGSDIPDALLQALMHRSPSAQMTPLREKKSLPGSTPHIESGFHVAID